MGSLLVDRDNARAPPRSPPEPAPQPQFEATAAAPQLLAGPEVTDPLGGATSADLGPSLADQFGSTATSPPFSQRKNKPQTGSKLQQLEEQINTRQQQIRTISRTGSRTKP